MRKKSSFSMRKIIALTLAFVFLFAFTLSDKAYAQAFKDVPAGHWAYQTVDRVTNLGFMLGDLSGNFNPNELIDKFEASKILAKMAGFKNSGATAAEQSYIDRAYINHRDYISLYSTKFSKWNSAVNKEIAFLLEKGILVREELNQFVVVIDFQERTRALTKEEACVFFVRLMGKVSEAQALKNYTAFKDDSSITISAKASVYYLRSKGVIALADRVEPKSSVSKAIMAVLTDKVYYTMNPAAATPAPTAAPIAPTPLPQTSNPSAYESIQGTIVKLYPSSNMLQISSALSSINNRIYKASATATIKVNGTITNFANLAEGMSFTGIINNGELISLAATTANIVTVPPIHTQIPFVTPPPIAGQTTTIEGIVSNLQGVATGNIISIEIKIISPRNDITTETRSYSLASNCVIKRGDAVIGFNSIVKGDIAKIDFNGSTALNIALEVKNRSFSGIITDKSFNDITGTAYYTITESNDKKSELVVTSQSKLNRRSMGSVAWNDIRLGDSVDVNTEYQKIVDLYAYGTITTVDVTIKKITISKNISHITVTDVNGKEQVFNLINGYVDPYTLRVGSKVRLRLDSSEVESFTILSQAIESTVTGQITSVSRNYITVKDTGSSYFQTKDVQYDANTVVIDASTGNKVSTNNLSAGQSVYIYYSETNRTYAKTITILNY